MSSSTNTKTPLGAAASPSPPSRNPLANLAKSAAPIFRSKECLVEVNADQMTALLNIPPEIISRLKSRAGNQDMGEYLWLNVFRPALMSHVY